MAGGTVFKSARIDELTDQLDAFGHLDYAAAIAKVITEADAPFTLGLFGPWGVGKTVTIEAACKSVSSSCATVIFDAWRYDGDALRRQFLRDVAQQLKNSGQLASWYDPKKELKDLEVSRSEQVKGRVRVDASQLWAGGLSLLLIGVVIAGLAVTHHLHHTILTLATLSAAALVSLAVTALSPFARVIQITQATEVRQRVVDPEKFTEKFEDVLAAVTKQRLVVAIDNLDRCSPRRVTELLETLNTYLEPASTTGGELSKRLRERRQKRKGRPDAVFIVAADDLALKRHVESLEAKASEGSVIGTRADVGRYADEYLRKIFTAAIPIKPVLGPDLRDYVDGQLEELCLSRNVEPLDRNRLIEVITEGLRRNPRRVTQFIRNLELRLLLLDKRHDEKDGHRRIVELLSVSEHIPVVAKLLVIEEEWPEAYARLERDPAVLERWHQQQQAGAPLETISGDADEPTLAVGEDEQAFRGFLATTRSLHSERLPALLSLKQSADELELPELARFKTALETGNGEELDTVVKEAGELIPRYADQLLPIFKAQLPRYVSAARNVVETALGNPTLREHARPQLADLLLRAVRLDEAFRNELRQARPDAVLGLAATLPSPEFDQLVGLFVGQRGDGSAAFPVEELVGLPVDRISAENGRRIGEALSDDELALPPDAILRVLQWWPELATEQVGRAAIGRISAEGGGNTDPQIVLICLTTIWAPKTQFRMAYDGRSPSDDVIYAIGSDIFRRYQPQVSAKARVDEIATLVPLLTQISANDGVIEAAADDERIAAITSTVQQFESAAGQIHNDDDAGALLDIYGALAAVDGGSQVVPAFAQGLATTLRTSRPSALIEYSLERGGRLATSLVPILASELVYLVDAQTPRAAEALAAIDPDDAHGHLVAAVERMLASQLYAQADAIIRSIPVLSQHVERFAVMPLTSGETANSVSALRFTLAHADQLGTEGFETVEQRLADFLTVAPADDDATDLYQRVEASPAFEGDRLSRFVAILFDRLTASPSAAPIPLLQRVMKHFDLLDEERKLALARLIEGWFQQGAGVELIRVTSSTRAVVGKARTALVDVLLGRERVVPANDHHLRREFLAAAREIAAGAPTTVSKVNERVAQLQDPQSTPDDRAVYKLMAPSGE